MSQLFVDQIGEKTSGNKITLNNTLKVDTIEPKTSGGAVGLATPLFKLHKPSGNQSISNNTNTEVTWGTAFHDTHSIADLSNNRIVITNTTAGYWWIGSALYYSSRPPRGIIYIYKNGSNYAAFEHVGSGTGSTTYPTVFGSVLMQVVSGDIISINTYHNYGSAINVTDGSAGSWFNGYRVSI